MDSQLHFSEMPWVYQISAPKEARAEKSGTDQSINNNKISDPFQQGGWVR